MKKEKVTKEDIISDLKNIKGKIGKVPSTVDNRKHGKYSRETIRKKFGSWRNAIEETFNIKLPVNKTREIIKCLTCGGNTKNSKFCSSSCAAKFNNKKFPKRKKHERKEKIKICLNCNCEFITNRRLKYCESCKKLGCKKTNRGIIKNDCLLKDLIYTTHHKASAFGLIRSRARTIAKNNDMNQCAICGYSEHVEISHKKPISSYSLDTPISEINSIDNLQPLCPNCHWEYDHKLKNNLPIPIENYDYCI